MLAGLQLTPRYTATAMVMIDPRKSNVVDVEVVIQGLGTDASTVESQIRLISSRYQLERLATDLGIFDDPEFNAALRAPDRDVQCRWPGRSSHRLLAAGILAGRHRTGGGADRGRRGRPALSAARIQTIEEFADGTVTSGSITASIRNTT